MKWLIYSHEHSAWWRASHLGYANKALNAGRYTFDEALDIVRCANEFAGGTPNETMCPEWPGANEEPEPNNA